MQLANMNAQAVLVLILLSASGCAGHLTPRAYRLAVVTEKQREESCRVIGMVVGSNSMGMTYAQDMEGALVDARNKAAALGANAVRILNQDSGALSSVVTA